MRNRTRVALIRVLRIVAASLIGAGSSPGAISAQQISEGAACLVVPGFVFQRATFGDDDPRSNSRYGPTIGVQIRGPRAGSTTWVFEATGQMNAVENPHFAERFVPFYAQPGAQVGRKI